MRLTVMTDYALRLLVYLARHPDRRCTIVEVAQAHAISEAHLMKVTHRLGVHGWILTSRGRGGGMRLAHPPAEIGIGAVVRSMETDFRLAECFGPRSTCALTGDCRLAGILRQGLEAFFRGLDSRTLADIVAGAPAALPQASLDTDSTPAVSPTPIVEALDDETSPPREPSRRASPGRPVPR